ncbi:Fic family protein [Jeongeupia sp. USM3]|uniref:Fic/DOC family protein n=1 Tax=Jeongeupia sp. USM3 TaxID=1906741 RepID=UPI000AEECAB4|nr:Fic family protein [Jeongeupia sp. USM3]
MREASLLAAAERDLSDLGAAEIGFAEPPYDLPYWQRIHYRLFGDVYDWAGEIRRVDIAKAETRFCNAHRIVAEAGRLFAQLAQQDHFVGLALPELIAASAELYVELNMLHPFREGNGRAQRILFEHLIINTGHVVDWRGTDRERWLHANIAGVHADYGPMQQVFARCIKEAALD